MAALPAGAAQSASEWARRITEDAIEAAKRSVSKNENLLDLCFNPLVISQKVILCPTLSFNHRATHEEAAAAQSAAQEAYAAKLAENGAKMINCSHEQPESELFAIWLQWETAFAERAALAQTLSARPAEDAAAHERLGGAEAVRRALRV